MGKIIVRGDDSENIIEIRRRACRIWHGSISWLATLFANVLTIGQSHPIEHQWIEIETDKAYYCVQLWKNGDLEMHKAKSIEEVNDHGFRCVNKPNDSDVWTTNTCSYPFQDPRDFDNNSGMTAERESRFVFVVPHRKHFEMPPVLLN